MASKKALKRIINKDIKEIDSRNLISLEFILSLMNQICFKQKL